MDAPNQGIRKGDKEEHGKDDLRMGRNGRYEGGRDSDQDRQAVDEKRREGDAPAQPVKPDEGRGGDEEE